MIGRHSLSTVGVLSILIGLHVILFIRFQLPISYAKISISENISIVIRNGTADPSTPVRSGKDKATPFRVRFRHFAGDPQHHNTSVTGESLPGPFFDEKLFLIGARLTTSYLSDVSDVHVDVFGFPGDWVSPELEEELSPLLLCTWDDLTRNWTLPKFDNVSNHNAGTMLYCQVECNNKDSSDSKINIDEGDDCGVPIEMTLIPLNSGDSNQRRSTFIWRCNVTQHLSKPDIMTHIATMGEEESSVRVRLWYGNHTHGRPLKEEISNNHLHRTELDIPLHTAVVGHGGPQIRSPDKGYFASPESETPMQIGLCLSIYGENPTEFLAEFVQHHKNIGIDHIVVGVETNMGSGDLRRTEAILRPHIDEGFVVMQSTGLRSYFSSCDPDVLKLHFYHQCIYHFKGLSKYAGIWDLDEYWIPPDRSKSLDKNYTVTRDYEGYSGRNPFSSTNINNRIFVDKTFDSFLGSKPRLLSDRVTSDPLWQSSKYSMGWSIQDVMGAIEASYNDNGCGQRWCFHLFPSYIVFLDEEYNRTGRIGYDFYKRTKNSTRIWKKSIVQTRYAMMGGFHVPGSCQYPDDPEFYAFAAKPECLPQIWDAGEAGSLHHFISLVGFREEPYLESDVIEDEYLVLYAETVSMQLDQDNVIADS